MLVPGVLSAFIILITFVFILLFYIRKIGRMKKSLLESKRSLHKHMKNWQLPKKN
jgi:hypothetical protein